MTLYIDTHEPDSVKSTVKLTIADRDTGVDTEIKGLKTSDFVYDNVAIERKEASDLAQSIKDRRLKEQTVRMLEDFEHAYIIVEGNPYDLKYTNLHDNSFIGTLTSRAEAGCRIIYTPDIDGTAYAINKIIEKHEESDSTDVELKRTNADTEDVEVAMLTCIKGISKEKAEDILETTSIMEIAVNPGEVHETLKAVDGIGSKLADRIIKSF